VSFIFCLRKQNKKNPKSQTRISGWSASFDLHRNLPTRFRQPKWGFSVVFPLPFSAVFALPPGCASSAPLPAQQSRGACSTAVGTLRSPDGFPQPACCLLAPLAVRGARLLLGRQMPLLSPEVSGWKLALQETGQSHAQSRLSEGRVIWGTRGERYRMPTSALAYTPLSLSASNWKTTLLLAELSLSSFCVSL